MCYPPNAHRSLPTRQEVEQLLAQHGADPAAKAWDAPELLAAAAVAAAAAAAETDDVSSAPSPLSTAVTPHSAAVSTSATAPAGAGGGGGGGDGDGGGGADGSAGSCANPDDPAAAFDDVADADADGACPLLFGARLNSMKARTDLLQLQLQRTAAAKTHGSGGSGGGEGRLRDLLQDNGPLGWVARQGLVGGGMGRHGGGGGDGSGGRLDVVYFNYPEHLAGRSLQQVGEGGVCGRGDVLCCTDRPWVQMPVTL